MNKFIKKSSQGTSNDKHMKVYPICGHEAIMTSGNLGRPNGHGYPDRTWYEVSCSYCDIMPKVGTIDMWNENCDEVEELLSWRNK